MTSPTDPARKALDIVERLRERQRKAKGTRAQSLWMLLADAQAEIKSLRAALEAAEGKVAELTRERGHTGDILDRTARALAEAELALATAKADALTDVLDAIANADEWVIKAVQGLKENGDAHAG